MFSRNKKNTSVIFTLIPVLFTLIWSSTTVSKEVNSLFDTSDLSWRSIGPYRGGRVTTVTGIDDNPMLYYMGATGGGVWKTLNAGATWENISDGFFDVGTIGAIAVANSDNNVIYVGTGESPIRGVTTSEGVGVYKSTNSGKTWVYVGLKNAGQISRIKVHPNNPDIAYVAVQGKMWTPNEERGVYKTTDGGKTWVLSLKINKDTGASDLKMDPTNPRILYAAMWHHGRKPWYIKSGGAGGGIYKSIDSGDTWKQLTNGLPDLVGKIGIDVAASNPSRLYAIIEAEIEKGGLYRSDDAGENWDLIDNHRVLHSRAWYYNHITADPQDEDTVWVLNVPLMKSIDAGKTWEKISTPHGDHHDHWINPHNNLNMINGNDGGATITFDGGKTWSSIMNQPTAQFYRVTTDNLFPYRIYAGQQDNSTVAIASQSFQGGIGVDDYFSVGGGESAHIALNPDDPKLIYATTINGTLTEFDSTTKIVRSIIPYPEVVYGKDAKDLKYRANWNPPVELSPHDNSTIYYGTQVLLKSTDRGLTWEEISPDLTRDQENRQGRNGGPLTPENVGAEFYNTIFYVVESALKKDIIWVGSDDGLIHITKDGGKNWQNISPKHPNEVMINAIELSPHEDGVAFAAVTGYKLGDNKPYIYKTTNYGKTWERIDRGLPEAAFVRVVREDPKVPGLLYAGTERGIYFSINNGKAWHSLQANLPKIPVTDLRIKQDNLIVATQGRAFWVLDDLFVIRQYHEDIEQKNMHLFRPDTTHMLPRSRGATNIEGKNPSRGVPLYYFLNNNQDDKELIIDIRNDKNELIKHFSSKESAHDKCIIKNMDPRSPFVVDYPKKSFGLNIWRWDMRSENMQCVEGIALFAGYQGPRVSPGTYKATIKHGDQQNSVIFEIQTDPRVNLKKDDIDTWSNQLDAINNTLNTMLQQTYKIRIIKQQIENLMHQHQNETRLQAMSSNAISAIDVWQSKITQIKHETLEDEDAWETMLAGQLRYLMDVVDRSGPPVTEGSRIRLNDLSQIWRTLQSEYTTIMDNEVELINDWAKEKNITHISGVNN